MTDPADIPCVIAEAFHLAGTGRPGPVLVDITRSALLAPVPSATSSPLQLPGHAVPGEPRSKSVRAAAELLRDASRPVLYVGGGVIRAGASHELQALAETTGIPVVTTLMARGAFPDSHPLHLGMRRLALFLVVAGSRLGLGVVPGSKVGPCGRARTYVKKIHRDCGEMPTMDMLRVRTNLASFCIVCSKINW
ncbi:hypothetical protein ACFX43_06155 [Nocardioides sp. YIM B13467]|uniref:hypothetical protein n=1 Tax=Nocardioides sp. YIM B13467 TaxID=3366294 RepID=UPI00366EF1D5